MANTPSKNQIKRILLVLKKKNRKYASLDMLSQWMGLYPDVLADSIEYFSPMIRMDSSINLMSLIPEFEEYVKPTPQAKEDEEEEPKTKRVVATTKEVDEFKSVSDFVYKKMTNAGGLIDQSYVLSEHDLRILQKLIGKELKEKKKPAKKTIKGRHRKV